MADLIAAFGGAAVLNRPVDKATAEMMHELYLEVVAAPDYEEGALDILKKAKNLRILGMPRIAELENLARPALFGHQVPHRRRHGLADQLLQPHQGPG